MFPSTPAALQSLSPLMTTCFFQQVDEQTMAILNLWGPLIEVVDKNIHQLLHSLEACQNTCLKCTHDHNSLHLSSDTGAQLYCLDEIAAYHHSSF